MAQTHHTTGNSIGKNNVKVETQDDSIGKNTITEEREDEGGLNTEWITRVYNGNIYVKLDECLTYLATYKTQRWTKEEKNLPLAFAILDHR